MSWNREKEERVIREWTLNYYKTGLSMKANKKSIVKNCTK